MRGVFGSRVAYSVVELEAIIELVLGCDGRNKKLHTETDRIHSL